jgi:hypothetical protein
VCSKSVGRLCSLLVSFIYIRGGGRTGQDRTAQGGIKKVNLMIAKARHIVHGEDGENWKWLEWLENDYLFFRDVRTARMSHMLQLQLAACTF